MEKITIYLITLIIISLTILGVSGEYFSYKYYSILATRQTTQQVAQQTQTNTNTNNTRNQTTPLSSEKLIDSFNFKNPMAVGNIDQLRHTITITVPPITDITKLTPIIEVSNNSTLLPQSGVTQDFTNPIAYLVTAQDGSTQNYMVTVNVASILKSIEKSITSFKLSGINPEVDGIIDDSNYTVYAVVPDGTDLTKLAPTIGVSDGATISPASGNIQDFTNPVIYTVTDSYGDKQNYTITVLTESNSG